MDELIDALWQTSPLKILFDMFVGWLGSVLQTLSTGWHALMMWFWDGFSAMFQYLIETLNPYNTFGDAVMVLAESLPPMDPGTPLFIDSLIASTQIIVGFLRVSSYFLDLNVFVATIAFMAIAESGLIGYRAWLTFKRAIPVIG
jgi:hypothetical protein